tara:strand:+ start:376 stop:573 length:198 start_codon:yes stop_codon:yes gene_type:complete
METLIVGLVVNMWTLANIDFFAQRSENERMYNCEWVDVGWQKTNPENPSINILGYVKYLHVCEEK